MFGVTHPSTGARRALVVEECFTSSHNTVVQLCSDVRRRRILASGTAGFSDPVLETAATR